MDIRYHAGGYEPQTVFPGQNLVMLMEFQGMDVILPAGHGIKLVLTETERITWRLLAVLHVQLP